MNQKYAKTMPKLVLTDAFRMLLNTTLGGIYQASVPVEHQSVDLKMLIRSGHFNSSSILKRYGT